MENRRGCKLLNSNGVIEIEEDFRDFIWHKGTTQVKEKILSDCGKTCDIVRDKMLGG